jgi:hypothetical protein
VRRLSLLPALFLASLTAAVAPAVASAAVPAYCVPTHAVCPSGTPAANIQAAITAAKNATPAQPEITIYLAPGTASADNTDVTSLDETSEIVHLIGVGSPTLKGALHLLAEGSSVSGVKGAYIGNTGGSLWVAGPVDHATIVADATATATPLQAEGSVSHVSVTQQDPNTANAAISSPSTSTGLSLSDSTVISSGQTGIENKALTPLTIDRSSITIVGNSKTTPAPVAAVHLWGGDATVSNSVLTLSPDALPDADVIRVDGKDPNPSGTAVHPIAVENDLLVTAAPTQIALYFTSPATASYPTDVTNTAFVGPGAMHYNESSLLSMDYDWATATDPDPSVSPFPLSSMGQRLIGTHNAWGTDPGFVDPSTLNYRLKYSSPLLDAGDATPAATGETDLGGAPRLVNGQRDIGPYEYQRTPPTVQASSSTRGAITGGSVTFAAVATVVDPGDVLSGYTWSFDDGSATQTGSTIHKSFATAGTHTVTVTAADALGLTSTATVQLLVSAPIVVNHPTGSGVGDVGVGTPSTNKTTPAAPAICVVPKVVHLTLAKAKAAIVKAKCTLGKALKPKKAKKHKTLKVTKQGKKAGMYVAAGTPIIVRLAY